MPPRTKKRDDYYRDRRRRKVCSFCADKTVVIDYSSPNVDIYLAPSGGNAVTTYDIPGGASLQWGTTYYWKVTASGLLSQGKNTLWRGRGQGQVHISIGCQLKMGAFQSAKNKSPDHA